MDRKIEDLLQSTHDEGIKQVRTWSQTPIHKVNEIITHIFQQLRVIQMSLLPILEVIQGNSLPEADVQKLKVASDVLSFRVDVLRIASIFGWPAGK
jgi:hypothetical protein